MSALFQTRGFVRAICLQPDIVLDTSKPTDEWVPPQGINEEDHQKQERERFKAAAVSHLQASPVKPDEAVAQDDIKVRQNAVGFFSHEIKLAL